MASGQNEVMKKVPVQVRPSETFTARVDGNVFISLSNSSRGFFHRVIKEGAINSAPRVKELLSSDNRAAARDQA